jgi:hypothetical protein
VPFTLLLLDQLWAFRKPESHHRRCFPLRSAQSSQKPAFLRSSSTAPPHGIMPDVIQCDLCSEPQLPPRRAVGQHLRNVDAQRPSERVLPSSVQPPRQAEINTGDALVASHIGRHRRALIQLPTRLCAASSRDHCHPSSAPSHGIMTDITPRSFCGEPQLPPRRSGRPTPARC